MFTQLYKPLCRSVGLSVRRSVTLYFFFLAKWLIELRVRDLRQSALFLYLRVYMLQFIFWMTQVVIQKLKMATQRLQVAIQSPKDAIQILQLANQRPQVT